ncbi:MAG: polyprenol monophosphomannose synthase [Planctomycetota bacterium]|jgi:dolichol-phosphate mannosyltransferase|nr:polyprenol monophosphomannose synthase [Planctomycetota bacterium]
MKRRLVLPTYDEANNLPLVVDRVLALPEEFEILVVDDDSPDGTGRVANQLQNRYPQRVQVLHRKNRRGLGTAYVEGFLLSLQEGYDQLFQMDCDLSHRPEDLSRLASKLDTFDVVLGSRYIPGGSVQGWAYPRRIISRFGSLYARTLLKLSVHDATGGFRAFRRNALETIDLKQIVSQGYAFQVEIAYRAQRRQLALTEIPICFIERESGQSKMNFAIALEAAWKIPLLPRILRQQK